MYVKFYFTVVKKKVLYKPTREHKSLLKSNLSSNVDEIGYLYVK